MILCLKSQKKAGAINSLVPVTRGGDHSPLFRLRKTADVGKESPSNYKRGRRPLRGMTGVDRALRRGGQPI